MARNFHRSALAVALIFALTGTSARADEKLTYGVVGNGSAQQWALWIAQEKGFSAEKKLDVDIVVTPSAASVLQQIVAGGLDLGTAGLTTPILAIDQGIPVAILGIETQAPPYSLWSKPAIRTIAALEGKTISVGGAKDITRTYLEGMLKPNGVQPGQYDLVYAGSAAARFAALAAGAADAALLNPPTSFKAKEAGFQNLGDLTDYVQMPFTGYIVTTAWAKTHKQRLADFAYGISKAVVWFETDGNRQEAIAILQKISKANVDDVSATYDLYRKLKVFPRDGSLRSSKIESIVAAMKSTGELKGPTDLGRFIDPDIADIFTPNP